MNNQLGDIWQRWSTQAKATWASILHGAYATSAAQKRTNDDKPSSTGATNPEASKPKS